MKLDVERREPSYLINAIIKSADDKMTFRSLLMIILQSLLLADARYVRSRVRQGQVYWSHGTKVSLLPGGDHWSRSSVSHSYRKTIISMTQCQNAIYEKMLLLITPLQMR